MQPYSISTLSPSEQDIRTQVLMRPIPGHDCLTVRADIQKNLHNLGFKAHVKHTVSFIQHLSPNIRKNKTLNTKFWYTG